MRLAKPVLDLGLYTNRLDAQRAFWEATVGLAYEEYLKIGGGVRQHRLGVNGAVLKLNDSREPLGEGPSGLRSLRVASRRVDRPVALADPDGLAVTVVPPGTDGVDTTEVTIVASSKPATERFWVEGLGAARLPDGRLRVGRTLVAVVEDPAQPLTGDIRARGFRYLTAQVFDVVAEHARFLALGFTEGTAPVRLGDTAFISMVRDPGGNWLELSQRADLTGHLPDDAPRRW